MIASVAGEIRDGALTDRRPFRAPHHSASMPALVGGGLRARPGEVSLAHHGVLFLDELPEFQAQALDSLRQPLESGEVAIARANHRVTYPARFMLVDASGREQRFYSDVTPRLLHGDEAIRAVQHWLQNRVSQIVTIGSLAARAGLGERTFIRRFIRATGMTPTEYHQRLRVAQARRRLELTNETVEQIAAAVGYEDAAGLRRVFKRMTGMSPAEYRKRFAGPCSTEHIPADASGITATSST